MSVPSRRFSDCPCRHCRGYVSTSMRGFYSDVWQHEMFAERRRLLVDIPVTTEEDEAWEAMARRKGRSDTQFARDTWESVERNAAAVKDWPEWKKVGSGLL